jgi:6,7-dimethyl-8-ribityllumazine synthase
LNVSQDREIDVNRRNVQKPKLMINNPGELRIGIVVAKFNEDITSRLLEGAVETLIEHGVSRQNIEVKNVPGGFEIPLACQKMARAKQKPNAIIAIGCVIRGDTDHYVYIANESTRGVMDVMLSESIHIANCILTVNTLEQAELRAVDGEDNKGREAAIATLVMAT